MKIKMSISKLYANRLVWICFLCICLAGCEEGLSMPYKAKHDSVLIQTDVSKRFLNNVKKTYDNSQKIFYEMIPLENKREDGLKINIFNNYKEFAEYQSKISATKSPAGFYVPHRRELVLMYQGSKNTLLTMHHELFHVYFEDRIIHPPAWLNEGFAQCVAALEEGFVFSSLALEKHYGVLKEMIKTNALPSIETIVENDWENPSALTPREYALSWSIVAFLRFSGDKEQANLFIQYLRCLYDKETPSKAFKKIWPDYNAFNVEWHKFIRKEVKKGAIFKLLPRI